jgi:hypothetical protein
MPQMKTIHSFKSNFEKNFKFVAITLLLLTAFQLGNVYGQIQLVPIGTNPYMENQDLKSARTQVSRSLPFFEDFSTTTTRYPDAALWMPGGGVFINNTMATTQPSVNLASFDGLDASGNPYDYLNQLSSGVTDTLTSVPINLAGLTVADSVYISFHWLAKGLVELPDGDDSLTLEFLDKNKRWVGIWGQKGMVYDTLFTQNLVAVQGPEFFYDGFQFRFKTYGKRSGGYDTWHLDYIYLNKGRSANDRYVMDLAVTKPLTPFFKHYTAMPLKQYWVNPGGVTATHVVSEIYNLAKERNTTTYTFTVQNEATGQMYQTFTSPTTDIIDGNETQTKRIALNLNIPKNDALKALKLKYKFKLNTSDRETTNIPSVDLRRNDTISAQANLSDYYAYDDETAEYGVQVNQRLARVALRFGLSKPDTLAGVNMSIVPFNKDISGQSFTIQVWSNKDGKPDQVLVQKSVTARYPEQRDGFISYAFDTPIAVADTFYVGWIQINEEPLSIGFDRNSLLGTENVFFNLGTEWVRETGLKGSIMIRPYMGGKATGVITGNEPGFEKDVHFFPNPNKGLIYWKSSQVKKIEIFALQGHLVKTVIPVKDSQSAVLGDLADGMYIFKASDGKRSFVQKMLIVK